MNTNTLRVVFLVAAGTMVSFAGADTKGRPDESYITPDNYRLFCNSNEKLLKVKPRGIVLEFPGLGGSSCLGGNINMTETYKSKFAEATAEAGLLHLYTMPGPWSWMNPGAVRLCDLLVDAARRKFGLGADTPLVATGGSMGGLGALVYTARSRHRVTACAAACPCFDVPALYDCKASFPRTYLSAIAACDMPLEKGLEAISPAHLVNKMPNIPYLVVCDEKDEIFDAPGMDAYVGKLRAAGLKVEYIRLPDLKHGQFTPEARKRLHEFVTTGR